MSCIIWTGELGRAFGLGGAWNIACPWLGSAKLELTRTKLGGMSRGDLDMLSLYCLAAIDYYVWWLPAWGMLCVLYVLYAVDSPCPLSFTEEPLLRDIGKLTMFLNTCLECMYLLGHSQSGQSPLGVYAWHEAPESI